MEAAGGADEAAEGKAIRLAEITLTEATAPAEPKIPVTEETEPAETASKVAETATPIAKVSQESGSEAFFWKAYLSIECTLNGSRPS